jgi:hypothetical protein
MDGEKNDCSEPEAAATNPEFSFFYQRAHIRIRIILFPYP